MPYHLLDEPSAAPCHKTILQSVYNNKNKRVSNTSTNIMNYKLKF